MNTNALFDDISPISSLEREIFETNIVEKIKTRFVFNNVFTFMR
jgi:hypothetical protein